MSRKIFVILLCLNILFAVACKNEALPVSPKIPMSTETKGNDAEYAGDNSEVIDAKPEENLVAAELLSTVDFGSIHVGVPTSNRLNAVQSGKAVYVKTNFNDKNQMLYELNFETGMLDTICRDPLCSHRSISCVMMSYYLSHTVGDDGTIYVLGEQNTDDDKGKKFIAVLDPDNGTLDILHHWRPSLSANSLSFEYNDGYLYYTKATSDTTNAIYRFNIQKDKEELVSKKDEYIMVFAVHNGSIYYRNNYGIMSVAPLDFDTVTQIDTGVSIIFPLNDDLYYYKTNYTSDGTAQGHLLYCMDITTNEVKCIISGISSPSNTLYSGKRFYYTQYDYEKTHTIYSYSIKDGAISEYIFDVGISCNVSAVLDSILFLSVTCYDPIEDNTYNEMYLYSTVDKTAVQLFDRD